MTTRILISIVYQLLWPVEVRLRIYRSIRGARLLLFDRHPLLDTVPPIHGSNWLKRIYAKAIQAYTSVWVPLPHIVFVCHGDIFTIWNRKKEHSFEVIKTLQEHYLSLSSDGRFEGHLLQTDCSIDTSCSNLLEELLSSHTFRAIYG